MIVSEERLVKQSGSVCLRFKSSQYVKPELFTLEDALEAAYASPEFHLGTQWFQCRPEELTAATPFRYWCVLDFDDDKDPSRALRQCFEFILSELNPKGLQKDVHYTLAVSGTKGAKVFFRYMPYASAEAPRVWHTYLEACAKRWDTLDSQVAFHSTLRGPWSRHPKRKDRFQVVIRKSAGVMARDPQWALSQALSPERPAFGEFVKSLPLLEDPPPAFLALWQAAEDAWLKRKVADGPKRPRPSYSRRGTDLPAILDHNGIGYREGSGLTGERYFRLTRCIFCGAKSKSAIKEKSLFYDCFRQSCEASSGLNFTQWTEGLDVPSRFGGRASGVYNRTLELRSRAASSPMPLVKARHILFEQISKAIDERTGTSLVSCTPGLGKTHTTLAVISDRLSAPKGERPKTVIACQTKELSWELRNRSVEFQLPPTVKRVVLEGRNDENCSFSRQVATIGALGWSPGRAFCAGCPYHGTCKYYRTVKDAADKTSLVFTTHEQAIAMIDSGQIKAELVVWDEDPFRAIHQSHSVGIREIRKARNLFLEPVVDAAHFLALAMNIASESMPEDGKLHIEGVDLIVHMDDAFSRSGLEGYDSWRDMLVTAASYAEEVEPSNGRLAGASSSEIRSLTPRSYFHLLEELVREHDRGRSGEGWNPTSRLVVRSDGLVFWQVQRRARPRSFMPHLILDAYGDPTLYERLLGVPVEDVKVEADLSRSSWHYVPVRTSRDALADAESPAWKEMDRVMSELQKAGDVLVGTYMAYSQMIRDRYECDVFHFGRGRGIDAYKECRGVVVFGVPQPPRNAVLERARFFFQEDALPIDGELNPKNRRLFEDFRVQKTLDSMRESEAAQLVHRVRPAIEARTIVCIGLVDYPALPVPTPFPRRKDAAHIDAMEAWVREWFDTHGWFTPALIGEGVCPIPPIPRGGKLWKKIFGDRGVSLSPHPTLSARRVWGDRELAREWVRGVAREQGVEHWEEL